MKPASINDKQTGQNVSKCSTLNVSCSWSRSTWSGSGVLRSSPPDHTVLHDTFVICIFSFCDNVETLCDVILSCMLLDFASRKQKGSINSKLALRGSICEPISTSHALYAVVRPDHVSGHCVRLNDRIAVKSCRVLVGWLARPRIWPQPITPSSFTIVWVQLRRLLQVKHAIGQC